jgi:hypothetical protein
MGLLRQEDILRQQDIENLYMNGEQTLSFTSSTNTEIHFPYQSIEDFNKTEGSLTVEETEINSEPLFGEHVKEAKQILKNALKKK